MVTPTIIKTFKSKKGNTVIFRYPTKGDLDAMLAYANELVREDTFIELSGKELTREEEGNFLDALLSEMANKTKVYVVVEIEGKYAGSGEVRVQMRRKKHVGELGISLSREYREEGVGTELMKELIQAGRSLGLRLLVLHCFENNPRALHMYEKLGFVKAGMVPGAIFFKGNYVGEIKMYLPLE